ncbi:uncharacterized protein IL334_003710 [Kwoniella shivajii]|uniref:F-box domain-containing protein n=1 Tax=Kwoniella shivajii TaxID=564305 RepID=A0ABZ1D2D7_9TREE|nr:hypothetical protein IL334_003710 [Kwoniella shivajii]
MPSSFSSTGRPAQSQSQPNDTDRMSSFEIELRAHRRSSVEGKSSRFREVVGRDVGQRRLGIGKDIHGWNELPINILQSILSYYVESAIDETTHFYNVWKDKTESIKILRSVQKRISLCQLRMVGHGWKDAVDSHPFWLSYSILLDPLESHLSPLQRIHSNHRANPLPSFPTRFHHARNTTLRICLACRLNHPSRLSSHAPVARHLTHTSRLSLTPTCDRHLYSFCSGCMKESGVENYRDLSSGNNLQRKEERGSESIAPLTSQVPILIGLLPCQERDTDETQSYRPRHGLVCKGCRHTSLLEQIKRVLSHECARNHVPGYLKGSWSLTSTDRWTSDPNFDMYVEDSSTTVIHSAIKVVELQWVINHTRFKDLLPTAIRLQRIERLLKHEFYHRGLMEDDLDENIKYSRLSEKYELEGNEFNGEETHQDRLQLQVLYNQWNRDIRLKSYKAHLRSMAIANEDEHDEFSEDEDDDDQDDIENSLGLNMKYQMKLQDGSINEWLTDRIRFGFWVSPSDEVATLRRKDMTLKDASPGIDNHVSFDYISAYAKHPFENHIEPTYRPEQAFRDHAGLMDMRLNVNRNFDPFLPPDSLLILLDRAFEERLIEVLEEPLNELAGRVADYLGDDEEAEKICSTWSVQTVITKLNDWRLWVPNSLIDTLEAKQATLTNEQSINVTEKVRVKPIGHQQRETVQSSPRIELVHEDASHPLLADYGIKATTFTPSSEISTQAVLPQQVDPSSRSRASPEDESPKLGKRKTTAEENEHQVDYLAKKETCLSPSTPLAHGDHNSPSDGSSTRKKRKLPPSPKPHHIDISQKTFTPPAPIHFDLDQQTRVSTDDIVTAVSSAPETPTPVVRPNAGPEFVGNVDMDEVMKSSEELFERSATEESSGDTIGTMPITPETEEWVESAQQPNVVTHIEHHIPDSTKHISHSDKQHQIVTVVDTASGQKSLVITPQYSDDEDGVDDEDQQPSVDEEEESVATDYTEMEEDETSSDLISIASASLRSNELKPPSSLLLSPEEILERYMIKNEKSVPFIPIPGPGIPSSTPDSNTRSNSSSKEWHLGPKTTRLIEKLWWDSRDVIRECHCTICTRASQRQRESNTNPLNQFEGNLKQWIQNTVANWEHNA